MGGGFIVVPALVLLGGLDMHRAVSTSLVIIALKSTVGFVKYLEILEQSQISLDIEVILTVSAVGIAGSLAGAQLAKLLPTDVLQRWFGYLLIVMGAAIGLGMRGLVKLPDETAGHTPVLMALGAFAAVIGGMLGVGIFHLYEPMALSPGGKIGRAHV